MLLLEGGAETDSNSAEAVAESRERLMVGLIALTGKIIGTADVEVIEEIVKEKNLIGEIFREFLFASFFEAQSEE